jgi:hypothetical protein
MVTEIVSKKIEELFHEETFACAFFENIESADEVKKLFAEKGVELSDEEVGELIAYTKSNVIGNESGELSESEMENVSGGVLGWIALGVASGIFFGYQAYQGGKASGWYRCR